MDRSRFPMKWYWIALLGIAVFAFFPLGTAIVASSIADAHGCPLHEGFANPCIVMGNDWGDFLYAMGVMTWLLFVTFPAGVLAFFGWVVVLVIHRIAWRRQQKALP